MELNGETPPQQQPKEKKAGEVEESGENGGEKAPPVSYTCVVCNLKFNSEDQANAHLIGAKHRKRVGGQGAYKNEASEMQGRFF